MPWWRQINILLPASDLSHLQFKVIKIDTSGTYVGLGLQDCPFSDPTDINRTFVQINGPSNADGSPDENLFLAARRDGSATLNKSDTIMKIQYDMIRNGKWDLAYTPMQPNPSGRINAVSIVKEFADDDQAPYEEIYELAKITKFHQDKSHNVIQVLERLQDKPQNVDPKKRHRSLLVVNETTKRFSGQIQNAMQMIACQNEQDNSFPSDSVVFSALVIQHGNVFMIKEDGDINPEGFLAAIKKAAKDDKKAKGKCNSDSLAESKDRWVTNNHANDQEMVIDGSGTLYRHTLEREGKEDVNVLYFFAKNVENVVTFNFELLPAMSFYNNGGSFFKEESSASVVKLVTIGGEIFSRGIRAKDKAHEFYLTDIWPSFQCSDRFAFKMVASTLIQLVGRINTVMTSKKLEWAKTTDLIPTIHIDKANWFFLKQWALANRQLMRVFMYDFNESGKTTGLDHMAEILSNPRFSDDAGTTFGALADILSRSIGQIRRSRNPRDIYAPMTRLGVIEDDLRDDISAEADLCTDPMQVDALVAQHSAEIIPGLRRMFQQTLNDLIPQLSASARFQSKLEQLRGDVENLHLQGQNGELSVNTARIYINALIYALRKRHLKFAGEQGANLNLADQGEVVTIPETIQDAMNVRNVTEAQKRALNFGSRHDCQGQHNIGGKKGNGSAGFYMLCLYIEKELRENRNPFV